MKQTILFKVLKIKKLYTFSFGCSIRNADNTKDCLSIRRKFNMNLGFNTRFSVGDRLILELNSKEIYEGDYADGARDRINLINVIQHNNDNKLGAIYEFYRSEIAKIHTLKLKPTKESPASNELKASSDCKVIKIVEDEYYRLKQMTKDYIYIENADSRYFDAVKLLNESETIGVVCLGMEKQRAGSLIRLLILSTWKQVYIFDLINCKSRYFHPELKEILESEFVCKVMHKSAGIVDVLYRWYDVYVQNTFDTQIVDLIIQKSKTGKCPEQARNVSECLVNYLNFPSGLLEDALKTSDKKWMERPLSEKRKLYASQLATYLILLKEHLQKIMLKSVYNAIDNVQDLVYSKSDFDFSEFMCSSKVTNDIDDILPALTNQKLE